MSCWVSFVSSSFCLLVVLLVMFRTSLSSSNSLSVCDERMITCETLPAFLAPALTFDNKKKEVVLQITINEQNLRKPCTPRPPPFPSTAQGQAYLAILTLPPSTPPNPNASTPGPPPPPPPPPAAPTLTPSLTSTPSASNQSACLLTA